MGPSSFLSSHGGPPAIDLSSSAMRVVTDPKMSAAAAALNSISRGENWQRPGQAKHEDKNSESSKKGTDGRARGGSFPDPPLPDIVTVPSAPEVRPPSVKDASIATPTDGHFHATDRAQLTLYTYKPSSSINVTHQPSPLPSKSSFTKNVTSQVMFNYKSLPWTIRNGDYLEIRRTDEEAAKDSLKGSKKDSDRNKTGGEALKGVSRRYERDGYIFRVGEDCQDVTQGQKQIPESVASAFHFQHRLEIDIFMVSLDRVPG